MVHLKTLEGTGGYIRLEGNSLFLTSDVKPAAEQTPGCWYDTSEDPAAPALVNAALPGAWDIAVVGKQAFVCDYTRFLTVYDMQPEGWKLVARLDTPSRTENIIVRGNLAYIATHTAGLCIVDISRPAAPVLVSNLNPKIDCDAIGLWKNCAILYAHWESRLVLVDVSDPAEPRQVGLYQHEEKTFIQGEMDVHEGIAYCTAGKNGLVIVDVNDPAAPKLLKVVEENGVRDVIVRDRYAFVAAARLSVWDISDPAKPVEVGAYRARATQIAVAPQEDGDYLVYAAHGAKPASVLRFSPPAAAAERD